MELETHTRQFESPQQLHSRSAQSGVRSSRLRALLGNQVAVVYWSYIAGLTRDAGVGPKKRLETLLGLREKIGLAPLTETELLSESSRRPWMGFANGKTDCS